MPPTLGHDCKARRRSFPRTSSHPTQRTFVQHMKYIALFILIQLASLILTIIGLPICALCAYALPTRTTASRVTGNPIVSFPKWAWLWSNDEDGVYPTWYAKLNPAWSKARTIFTWSALRNPVNNLRYVPGVSKKGRPLWRYTAVIGGKHLYCQCGWNGAGQPVLSGGANIYAD
jgi:hypothetical protein